MRSMRSHLLIVLIITATVAHGVLQVRAVVGEMRPLQTTLAVTVNPSSVVVKVGETVNVTITVTGSGDVEHVCFSLEGYPGGVQISFAPPCTTSRVVRASILTIEVTPAAAPQSFTAIVVARAGNQTAQSPLNVAIEPAMPFWVPWLGLALFFLFLGAAVFWNPKLPFKKASSSRRK